MAVQISHLQADVGYTERSVKGKRPLFTELRNVTVFSHKQNNKDKTNAKHVTEFLRYNL